jgi:cob(I)alamin adenosyltransferase
MSTINKFKKNTVELSTTLYNGDKVSKSNKILSTIGTIEELVCFIGIVKTTYFDPSTEEKFDIDNSVKFFLYARFTQIQETLIDIQLSLGTSKKIENIQQRISELCNEINLMDDVNLSQLKIETKEKPLQIIPGTTVLESKLLYVRTLCKKVERYFYTIKIRNEIYGEYFNKLNDYFLALSIHILHIQNKEPLKKVYNYNLK